MLLIDDEEERKKRLQEAMDITNRINSNTYKFDNIGADDDLYSKRLEEAMNITNSINSIEYESNFNIDTDDNDINKFDAYYKTLPQENKETISIKQENTNKSNNDSLLSKAAYLGKRTLSGIAGGITGIAQAALTDTANKLQSGKEKTRQEVLTNSIKNLINPTQAVIDNIINSQKEMVNIIKDDNKNLIQKVVAIATKSATDAMDNTFPLAKSINETVGNFIPEASSQFMNLNEQISKPVEDWKRNLAEEEQNYGTVTNTLGNVGEAVGNMIPSIAATIATKNPNIGLATMGVSAKGQSTQEALSKGAELEEAVRIGNTKGMIEVGTEMLTGGVNIFGKGVLDDILEGVASKVSNNVARFFVKQGLDASGEILEETISDILGTIIDKGTVDPNATYSLKDWGETAIETTLTTFALNILTGGIVKDIQDINRQENKTEEHYDISDIKPFYVLDKSGNDINGVNLVSGLEIDNPNKKVNINPAIVKNTEIDRYNIIDAETGIALDTTPYDNIINAKLGFYHNIINLTDNQITDINRNILNTKMELYNNIESLMQEREIQNEVLRNQQNDTIEQNINQNQEINNQNSELAQNGISEKLDLNNDDSIEKSENYTSTNNKSFEDVAFDAMSNVDIEETKSPLQDRDMETIGKQTKVNAYQYDNPEVKPYFQEMAQMIGEDLSYISSADNRTSLKGGGTKLNTTTKAISILHDDLGYSYNDISKGLQNIIDDNGKENNAISKKLELIIDDQLRNGYTNALGKVVAPNQDYISTIIKNDKEVNINQRNVYQNEINTYKEKSKRQNKINTNINELNANILDGISKKKQSSFLNEYLKNEVKNHDYYVDGEKIIANSTTIGKLKNGKTNFNKNIDKDIRFELKANIIGNLENIIKTSRIYQKDRVDTKNHAFADTFDRRKSYIQYKGNRYEAMFEVGKKNGRNTLYSIENIKKVGYISSGISPMETSKTPKKVDRTNVPKNSVPQKGNSVKSKTEINTNIQDFGAKIGGARKDTAMPRGTAKTNTKEVIHDYTVRNTDNGYSVDFKGKTLKDGFKTQSEAEQYILDFKDNIKSNLAFVEEGTNGKGEKAYTIKIRNPRTLKSTYTNMTFSNKEAADNYAIGLSMYLKEYGKNLHRPEIQKVSRINENSKNSTKATGEDILNNFGFKGGEFGNWVTQNERQQFLNYAQDAFTDLATALNVLPSDLGQNGEMNIAFGARGKGLTGAVAHFEPSKKVINMTRLKGAGSLAHEYGHSIDNWLSRIGRDSDGMVTERMYNKNLSENMKSAIKDVEDALNYNITTNQEEVNKKNTIFEENRKKSLLYHLQYLDKVFSGEAKKMKRIKGKCENVPIEVTEQQKNEYQKIREILVKGELEGEITFKLEDSKLNTNALKNEKIYPAPIDTIQKMYKEVVGRKIDDDTLYWLFRYGKPSKQVTEVKSESAYKKSATELDKAMGRKEAYFSRTDEMWARAFEAYVSDKLKAKGITNTYLVHSVNNSDYALFNPFPAGEERQNINKAFDNLIKTMKDENILHDSKTSKVQNTDNIKDDGVRYLKKNNKQNKQIKTPSEILKKSINKIKESQGTVSRDDIKNIIDIVDFYQKEGTKKFIDQKMKQKAGKNLNPNITKLNNIYPNITRKSLKNYLNDAFNKSVSLFRNNIVNIKDTNTNAQIKKSGLDENYNKNYDVKTDKIKANTADTLDKIIEEGIYGYTTIDENDRNKILYHNYFSVVNYNNKNELIRTIIKEYTAQKNIENSFYYQKVESLDSFITKNEDLVPPYSANNSESKDFEHKSSINNSIAQQEDYVNMVKKSDNIDKSYKTNQERADAWIEQEIQKIEKTGKWDNSIPATSLTDIRKTIEDYLGLGIKKGKFRQNAYGIYKGNRDVIRTKELSDIDSILHETGHALDLGKRLNVDKESISNELLNAIGKLEGYKNETRTIKLEEGFAEVIREYAIVPNQAKIDYPDTVAVIEKIRNSDNNFDKFISKVQQQIYNYIHQNPDNRYTSKQSIGKQTDKPQMSKTWIEQEVIRAIWDKDIAVKNVVNEFTKISGKNTTASNNAYYLTRLASGVGDKVTSMLADGYINENGEKLMPGLNKVGEILGDNPQRYNDLRNYLVAKRDTDYKSKTLKTGLRDFDTNYIINKFKNDTQIQEATQVVYDTLDGVMQYAVDNGLISQDDVNKLKESNAFYVPMQRVIEGKGNQHGRKGAVKDLFKRRTGSELDIKDVLENIIVNSSNIIQQVENNNVLKALYNQGEGAGITGTIYDVIDTPMVKIGTANLSIWENELQKQGVNTTKLDLEKTVDLFAPNNKIDTKNLITSFIDTNGKRVYLQFNDEILFNSLMNLDVETNSILLKIWHKMKQPLQFGATLGNIGFAIPNVLSDTAQASVFSKAGFIPVVDNALGVLDVLTATNKHVKDFVSRYSPEYVSRIENMYNIYKQTGATSATRLGSFRQDTQRNMKEVYGTKNSEVLGINEKWKPLKRLLDLMTYIPELSEKSTRFRVFERNYDMYKSKGNSEMDTRILAALESRDATQDFGRMGSLTKELNQAYPFSAARIGSAYTFAEKVKANPKQTMMRIAVLTAIGMAIKGIGYDDKEIEELNQRKKDDNFVLKIGDQVVTIKKPQGILRSMLNLAEYIQDLATGHIDEGKEGERLGEWINNAIMDNMPANDVTGLVPHAIAPLVENAINKDLYYKTDIVKSYDLDLPDSEQYYDYNSQLAILLGKAFNYSPAKIDNLISGYFAGLGTQVTNIMDYVSGKMGLIAQKPEMGAESNSVGKRFIVNVNNNSASIDEIYNRKTELTKKKNGGTITSEEETELATITDAVSNISKVNKQIKEIKKDLTMSGAEKAEQIRPLQEQKTDIARQALGKDLIHQENTDKIADTSFYPTNSQLSLNNYKLELTSEMKKEYTSLASEFYKKYESQGLYNETKLKEIKTKAKEYAKKTLMQKYKSQLVKTK